jgi:hypothetical protein
VSLPGSVSEVGRTLYPVLKDVVHSLNSCGLSSRGYTTYPNMYVSPQILRRTFVSGDLSLTIADILREISMSDVTVATLDLSSELLFLAE